VALEAAIQKRIIAALRKRGAYVAKFSAGDVGTPDLLVCYEGTFFGMEVKQPKRYPTKIQRHRMEQIKEAGGVGIVVRSVEDAMEALDLITSELISMHPVCRRSGECVTSAGCVDPSPELQ
jgi:hypothetical protein